MEKIKEIIIEIIYFVLCMFFGSLWIVEGIHSIFSPIYENKTYAYNLVISVLAIALGIFLMNFWIKRYKKRRKKKE